MTYLKYQFSGPTDRLAILSAFLFEDGFEGIEEVPSKISAFINQQGFEGLSYAVEQFMTMNNITFIYEPVTDTNWNKAWEDTFTPIQVDDQCVVRARHHESKDVPFEVVIEPKMSFGTGHHPTTFLMISEMLKLDFQSKSVFDFGTGTGVLAILAELKGASDIFAVDIDPNCAENVKENILLNQSQKIAFEQADIDAATGKSFDIILANVTRNILLERWAQLEALLKTGGSLLISGFYKDDASYFESKKGSNMKFMELHVKDGWAVIVLKK